MARCLVCLAGVLLLFVLISVPAVSGIPGGYEVVPVSPDSLTGIARDPVPVSFFDLSPRVMAIGIVLSFFPLLLFPVELVFFLKILAWLGYRRIAGDPVLRNRNRARIHTSIREHPGISFPDLSRLTGIKRAVIRYHLAVLGMRGKNTGIQCLSTTCYFENNGQFSEFEKQMIIHLRNRIARMIVEMLVLSPGISRRDIADNIGIAGSSVTWYTNRLSRGASSPLQGWGGMPVMPLPVKRRNFSGTFTGIIRALIREGRGLRVGGGPACKPESVWTGTGNISTGKGGYPWNPGNSRT